MSERTDYLPGPATGANIDTTGGGWTLVLTRQLRHPPALVWEALTDARQLAEWAPFDADRNLGATGAVRLTTVGAPEPMVSDSTVRRVEAQRLLEFDWGGNVLRWELEPLAQGTRLTLWHSIDRDFIAWGAAGWHLCLDVLDRSLAGDPIGRIVGGDAMNFGWQRLVDEYAAILGVTAPGWQETKG